MRTNADIIDDVLRHEDSTLSGVCTDIPGDKGGKTKYGITQATWSGYVLRAQAPALPVNVCDITLYHARAFYNAQYLSGKISQFTAPDVRAALVDWNVNSGKAFQSLKSTLNLIEGWAEGDQGSTVTKELTDHINAMPVDRALAVISVARLLHYYKLAKADESQKKFVQGWFNRAFSSSNVGPLADDPQKLRLLGYVAGLLLRSLSMPSRLSLVFTDDDDAKAAIGGGLAA